MTIAKSDVEKAQREYLGLIASMPPGRERTAGQMAEVMSAANVFARIEQAFYAQERLIKRESKARYAADTKLMFAHILDASHV